MKFFSDDPVVALDLLEETTVPVTSYYLSVHALAGTEALETVHIHALVGN